jgi:hypothetical protein
MWGYAALIAASRVVVFAHFPSDVVAGAVVGGVGAVLVRDWFAATRLWRAMGAESRFPGPRSRASGLLAACLPHKKLAPLLPWARAARNDAARTAKSDETRSDETIGRQHERRA